MTCHSTYFLNYFGKMLQKWCELTSCNGIIDAYEAKEDKIRFSFWVSVMIVMSVASVWFTYRTIKGYMDTPTVTNVATVPMNLMLLPEVIVCYNGGYNVSAMKTYNLSEHFIRLFHISLNLQTRPVDMNFTAAATELDKFLKFNNMTLTDFVKKFSYNCEEIVTYSKRPNPTIAGQCNDVSPLITSLGNCYVFYNNKNQWYPGIWGGMALNLQVPNDSFIKHFPGDAFEANLQQAFSITFETTLINQQSKRSLLVPANTRAEITLHPIRYVRMGFPKSCINDDRMYTSNSCPWFCWQKELIDSGRCVPLDFIDTSNESEFDACNPLQYPPSNFNYANVLNCTNQCPVKCDEWLYEPTVTYSNWDAIIPAGTRSSVGFGYNTLQYTEVCVFRKLIKHFEKQYSIRENTIILIYLFLERIFCIADYRSGRIYN